MNKYDKRDVFTHEDYLKTAAIFPEEENRYITETAGFIPLEVKLKQFEQNGQIAQFLTSDFTSSDYRDIYLSPDFDITPEDDFEDVQEKITARNEYIGQLKKSKAAENGGSAAASGGKADFVGQTEKEVQRTEE